VAGPAHSLWHGLAMEADMQQGKAIRPWFLIAGACDDHLWQQLDDSISAA